VNVQALQISELRKKRKSHSRNKRTHKSIRNKASQWVLEKTGFQKEGVLRKVGCVRGKWADACVYSILREKWKKPKILTKPASQN
jgi:L-amino acid N-acyltransferase YncA